MHTGSLNGSLTMRSGEGGGIGETLGARWAIVSCVREFPASRGQGSKTGDTKIHSAIVQITNINHTQVTGCGLMWLDSFFMMAGCPFHWTSLTPINLVPLVLSIGPLKHQSPISPLID